jgi:hypothetical protein
MTDSLIYSPFFYSGGREVGCARERVSGARSGWCILGCILLRARASERPSVTGGF